jgi:hypothetical protein
MGGDGPCWPPHGWPRAANRRASGSSPSGAELRGYGMRCNYGARTPQRHAIVSRLRYNSSLRLSLIASSNGSG